MSAFLDALEGIINPGGNGKTIVQHKPIGEDRFAIVPHGRVVPRKDGFLARCGGPGHCDHCKEEQRRLAAGTHPYEVLP